MTLASTWPRVVGGVAVAAAAALLASCGGDGDPRPDLVLVSTRDGTYALYAMDADGSRQKRLDEAETDASTLQNVFFQLEPAWSPDGATIAFTSRRSGGFDIYLLNADGTGTRRLTSTRENEHRPSFSPDGARIVFSRGDPATLYVMDADGSNAEKLTRGQFEESDPAWSPDGEWIAFVRRTPGTDIREVWVVGADGTGRRRLTSLGGASYTPSWSPDSKRIVFTSDARESRFEIYEVGADGEGLRRITRSAEDAFDPAFSPDGELVAFSRAGAIVTIDASGSEKRLTDGDNNDSSPAWNPIPAPADE